MLETYDSTFFCSRWTPFFLNCVKKKCCVYSTPSNSKSGEMTNIRNAKMSMNTRHAHTRHRIKLKTKSEWHYNSYSINTIHFDVNALLNHVSLRSVPLRKKKKIAILLIFSVNKHLSREHFLSIHSPSEL